MPYHHQLVGARKTPPRSKKVGTVKKSLLAKQYKGQLTVPSLPAAGNAKVDDVEDPNDHDGEQPVESGTANKGDESNNGSSSEDYSSDDEEINQEIAVNVLRAIEHHPGLGNLTHRLKFVHIGLKSGQYVTIPVDDADRTRRAIAIRERLAKGHFEHDRIFIFPQTPNLVGDMLIPDPHIPKVLVGEGIVRSTGSIAADSDVKKRVPATLILHPAGDCKVYFMFDLIVKYKLTEGKRTTIVYGVDEPGLFICFYYHFREEIKRSNGYDFKTGRAPVAWKREEDIEEGVAAWRQLIQMDPPAHYDTKTGKYNAILNKGAMSAPPLQDTFKIGGYHLSLPGVAAVNREYDVDY